MILTEDQVLELRRRLKLNTIPEWKKLPGLVSQIDSMKGLLTDVFMRKRNEAVLVLGPGGCFKHLLVDYCLQRLYEENKGKSTNPFETGEYIVIRLDGDFIESDDDAFRIIARHLTSPAMRHKRFKNAQFKNMEFLEIVLQEAQICNVPLLFILDHFSAFCHQSKQTLLYTLLDMCSNQNVQMCVIGIDRDCAITEQLEKRIQSRFSQKQIILNYPSVTDCIQYTSSTLFLPGSDIATRKWNSMVKKVVLHTDFPLLITEQSALIPLSYPRLPESSLGITMLFWKDCFEEILSQNTINRNHVLLYLGVNDLALLITAKHYVQKQLINFCFLDMLEAYNKWTTSAHSFQFQCMTENRAWQSFQLLLHYRLLRYASGVTSVTGTNNKNEKNRKVSSYSVLRNGNEKNSPVVLSIPPDEIDRVMREGKLKCPTSMENWALKWHE